MRFKKGFPKNPAQFLVVCLAITGLLSKVPALKARGDVVASDEYITNLVNLFKLLCEEAKYNSLKLAQRNKVQEELRILMQKLLHFLEAVADDNDIALIQESGIELMKAHKKKGSRPQPAAATSQD
ncbi:MAG TPA: hypothetical protein VJ550_07795 [Geomonas sp.]|nr:hypothetical protein [Geomonas sp.]